MALDLLSLLYTSRGRSLIFSSFTLFEITKKSHTKITKSQINQIQKAQKSQITEKLQKNHTKNHKKGTKITKNHRKESYDFKVTKVTYANLRRYLPLARYTFENFTNCSKVSLDFDSSQNS